MATKDKGMLTVVKPEDEDEGGSFGPSARAVPNGNRADRRREAREAAKAGAKAKGQGPISIEELLGETAPVDVLGNGRFLIHFYIHKFTSAIIRPVETIELEINRLVKLQAEVKRVQDLAKAQKREVDPEDLPEIDIRYTGADLIEAYATALVGPPGEPEKGLIADWTLTAGGEKAPITREFLVGTLGADLVAMIYAKIRERWTPGEGKNVASA